MWAHGNTVENVKSLYKHRLNVQLPHEFTQRFCMVARQEQWDTPRNIKIRCRATTSFSYAGPTRIILIQNCWLLCSACLEAHWNLFGLLLVIFQRPRCLCSVFGYWIPLVVLCTRPPGCQPLNEPFRIVRDASGHLISCKTNGKGCLPGAEYAWASAKLIQ